MSNISIFEQNGYHREYITVEFDIGNIQRRGSIYPNCQEVRSANGIWYSLNDQEMDSLAKAHYQYQESWRGYGHAARHSRVAIAIMKKGSEDKYNVSVIPYTIEKTKEINKKLLLLN